ncbi:MAG: hypothetical protein JSR77_03765 [Planctomycetes bacterium]|nr:hypothetical protein [Planctomycetota bacterium]
MIQATSYPLIVQRVRYDAYGRATHWYPADVNLAGYRNRADRTAIPGLTTTTDQSGCAPNDDVTRSSDVGNDDIAACADRKGRVPAADEMIRDAALDHMAIWTQVITGPNEGR